MADEKNYNNFFRELRELFDEIKKNKDDKGKITYNPYLAMWSASNEVKLHTGLIHSFLDYGSGFLSAFLKQAGLDSWFGDISNVSVERERNFIDILICNDEKYIIIENKIYASDQNRQIERYIESIQNKGVEAKNIAVIYLTLGERELSNESLGEWRISDEYLINDNNDKVRYISLTHEKDTIAWIESCKKELDSSDEGVKMRVALDFYKNVIEKLKKDENMIVEFFKDNEERCELALKLIENQGEICRAYNWLRINKMEELKKKDWIITSDKEQKFKQISNTGILNDAQPFIAYKEKWLEQTFRYLVNVEKNWFGMRIFIKKDGSENWCKNVVEIVSEIKEMLMLNEKYSHIINGRDRHLNSWGYINKKDGIDWDKINQHLGIIDDINNFLRDEENNPKSKIYKLAQEVKNLK